MKRMIAWLLVAVMVLSCAGIVACGGDGGGGATVDDGGATTDGGGTTTDGGGTTDDGGGNGGGDDLSDIPWTDITSVSYTMETSGAGMPTTSMQVSMEGSKYRLEMEEQGQHMIYLMDYDSGEAYMYMPDMNMAYRIDIGQSVQASYDSAQDIASYDYDVIGTETFDGKSCLVVEYRSGGATVRSWIWKEHGFPVKTVTTTSEGTLTVIFTDIKFGDIPDSVFELPDGVTIIST